MRVMLLLLLFASPALAKSSYAPLPSEAYTAKTIAIVNRTNTQKVADRAYQELQKWGHFAVIQDPSDADIVLIIEMDKHAIGVTGHTSASQYGNHASADTSLSEQEVTDVLVEFILKGQKDPFFLETERAVLFRKSATKRGIDELKRRIDQGPTP